MTITDEILICANKLANAGKKPSIALVKSKLSQPAPLATIINTLKSWQHQPDFIEAYSKGKPQENQETYVKNTAAIVDSLLANGTIKTMIKQSLEQELTEIKKDLSAMKLLINTLSEQINQ